MLCDEIFGERADRVRVGDIESEGGDARVGASDFIERRLSAPGDDYFIAEGVEGFGERASDAGGAARDKNSVSCGFHDLE
jgi:hypothetical protein